MKRDIDIIACGHLCLDLLPQMDHLRLDALATPGRLYEVGQMGFSTGGSVSNTGLALHRLGVNVRLMSNIGADPIGQLIRTFIESRDPILTEFSRVIEGQGGSYTLVLSPAKVDRMFYQYAGTNAAFGADDIDYRVIERTKILHLGYPPLLPALIADDGAGLAQLFRQARDSGAITSLDMSLPDPNGASGQVDWRALLMRTLPYVDIFIPSLEEILFMLRRDDYERWRGHCPENVSRRYLDALMDELFNMGASSVIGVKLGEYGLYIRTGSPSNIQRLAIISVDVDQWANRQVWHPAFKVGVVGTTGAGDSAYAGFLTAMLKGMSVEEAARWACAVGACCVEAADSTSGVQSWDATQRRLQSDWSTLPHQLREM